MNHSSLDRFYATCDEARNLRYGDPVETIRPQWLDAVACYRQSVRMDCCWFLEHIWEKLGTSTTLPASLFQSTVSDLTSGEIKPFDECEVGDFVLFRWRRPLKHRRKQLFSHLGLKFDNTRVIHLSKHNPDQGVCISEIEELLEKMIVVSRENIHKATIDQSGRYTI